MSHTDLPLFAWQPRCQLIPFPMVSRIGKIRDVASKLRDKPTDRHADYYRKQVNDALIAQLAKLGLSEADQMEQLAAFWIKVENEMNRLAFSMSGNSNPKGAA